MFRKFLDLFLLVAFASLTLGIAFAGLNLGAARVIFGLPLALFMPGYTLTTAFLPSLAQPLPNRLMYAVGLSLALTILTGLLLNLTAEGLTAAAFTGVLGSISLGAGIVALLRRRQEAQDDDAAFSQPIVMRIRVSYGVVLAAAALLAVGALTVTRTAAINETHPGFTQLWLTPFYPPSEQYLEIGLHSFEDADVEYRVEFRIDDRVVSQWSPVRLLPEKLWQKVINVGTEPQPGERAEVVVYRLDNPSQVYRHVTLWFTHQAAG